MATITGLGPQLAKQGLKAMFNPSLNRIEEQARVGDSYVSSIASQSTDPLEKAVCRVATNASNSADFATSQVGVAEQTLNAVAAGVAGSVGGVLAQVGTSAMFSKDVTKIKDQAGIGGAFVSGIANESSDANEKVACSVAGRAWGSVNLATTQVAIAEQTLDAVKNGLSGPIGGSLAHLGHAAMFSKDVTHIDDQAQVALVFAAAVRDYATDPSLKAQASAALATANSVTLARTQVDVLGTFLGSVN